MDDGRQYTNEYYNGLLDNVCVWDKALNEEEVKYYYYNNPEGNETNLKAYWNFNEGSGDDIKNIANGSASYNGTNYNAEYILISDPIPDSDGDGVNDDNDDFPYDPL